jgi:hypothetical protein
MDNVNNINNINNVNNVNMIVAYANNNGIGYKISLPWKLVSYLLQCIFVDFIS